MTATGSVPAVLRVSRSFCCFRSVHPRRARRSDRDPVAEVHSAGWQTVVDSYPEFQGGFHAFPSTQ
jgi:hypothetical protein